MLVQVMYQIFVVCAPGLEPYLFQELHELGLSAVTSHSSNRTPFIEESGGFEIDGSLKDIYRANLNLATASRVIVRLGRFNAAAFSELRKKAGRLAWETYLRPGQPVAIRATCHKSKLYHSDAVIDRVAGAIGDHLGQPSVILKYDENSSQPLPQLVIVRLVHDLCTISIDSSGAPLHRRGYRQAVAKAPLRETLAAGLLLASGWDRISPLLDPFCGSGTIPIEAALLAMRIPPARSRHFAFMDWPGFLQNEWKEVQEDAEARILSFNSLILASDRDAGAIEMAQANAVRARVDSVIQFSRHAISTIEPPPGIGWIVTNPPYGVRVSQRQDLRDLYAKLGTILHQRFMGWRVGILCNDLRLIGQTGLHFTHEIPLTNGGIRVKFYLANVSTS